MGTKKRWGDLQPRTRKLILAVAAWEGALKVAALIDLAQRPSREVRGSKAGWGAALVLINAGGALPVSYFTRGRRASR